MARKPKAPKRIDTLTHDAAKRTNIPTAEFESVMEDADKTPIRLAYERRNRDMDPQLVWRGKDEQDESDLEVTAPPLFIQEKVHPKALVDALKREAKKGRADDQMQDLFADFNGLQDDEAKTEFYAHAQNWTNRLILGDSLQVMASLAERERLRGQVQTIYIDPPYGIKFRSNFQWSTTSKTVDDNKKEHITRDPEQVRAFRDTWRDGIHSYLSYLRDRISISIDLLSETGSIFVQISDENVHRVRAILDEVFGDENFCALIPFRKRQGRTAASKLPEQTFDFIVWYAKNKTNMKYRQLYIDKSMDNLELFYDDSDGRRVPLKPKEKSGNNPLPCDINEIYTRIPLELQSKNSDRLFNVEMHGEIWPHPPKGWSGDKASMHKMAKIGRLTPKGKYLLFKRFYKESSFSKIISTWVDTAGEQNAVYVVQTSELPIERCILMTSDPGDIVLDPTCGAGTTAAVSEKWGRRWISIDTSRVALALARARLMGARFPWFLLKDSPEGLEKEAELTRTAPKRVATANDVRQGFVYKRAPHITLGNVAKNSEIDAIWDSKWPLVCEALDYLNAALRGHPRPFKVEIGARAGQYLNFDCNDGPAQSLPTGENAFPNAFLSWEVPRNAPDDWPDAAQRALREFWVRRNSVTQEIDASIAAKAEPEFLYDQPFEDNTRIRVAGPFTVESLSPHRALVVGADDELIDLVEATDGHRDALAREEDNFVTAILENLRVAGVQQAHKENRITFTELTPWPGDHIAAEGRYEEGETRRRAGVFIGPEYGTVSRPDLVAAAREAADAGFDVLIACAFNFDAHAGEFEKLGRIPILKARMNPDLHMADELKTTKSGNLFVVFGEPDIDLVRREDGKLQVQINGVDVFKPTTGEVESSGPEGIACWFLDDDYNEESFFVRHAYFLGAGTDPYKALKTTLKAEIDEDAWATLNSNVSRPFDPPTSGRIAVKVINHLGDEVMKVFEV